MSSYVVYSSVAGVLHGVGWSSSSSAGAGSIGRSTCHRDCEETSYDVEAAI